MSNSWLMFYKLNTYTRKLQNNMSIISNMITSIVLMFDQLDNSPNGQDDVDNDH